MTKTEKLNIYDTIMFYPIVFLFIFIIIPIFGATHWFYSNALLLNVLIVFSILYLICIIFSIAFTIIKMAIISKNKLYFASVIFLLIIFPLVYIYYYLKHIRGMYKDQGEAG